MPNAGEVGRQSSGFCGKRRYVPRKDSGMKYLIMEDFAGQPVSFVFPRAWTTATCANSCPTARSSPAACWNWGPTASSAPAATMRTGRQGAARGGCGDYRRGPPAAVKVDARAGSQGAFSRSRAKRALLSFSVRFLCRQRLRQGLRPTAAARTAALRIKATSTTRSAVKKVHVTTVVNEM